MLTVSCSDAIVLGDAPTIPALQRTHAHQTEEQWIVGEVLTALAALAQPGQHKEPLQPVVTLATPATAAEVVYSVAIGPRSARLRVMDHIWSPETYAPVMAQLLGASQPPTADALVDIDVRTPLTTLTATALLLEADRVSAMLVAAPRSAAAHESAALVIGAFAMREDSGLFEDVRASLSRMTAHLAIANASRGGALETMDGTIARSVLLTLIGRQRDAVTSIDAFEGRSRKDGDRAWAHALRLRNTGDWRKARLLNAETSLERFEHGRALRARLGFDALLGYVDSLPEADEIDWQRIATAGAFTVEAGNRYTRESVAYELAEAAETWMHFHEGEATPERVIESLKAPRSAGVAPVPTRILDWSAWAAHAERHLLHALTASWAHSRNFADESELVRTFDRLFAPLTLYPIVQRFMAESPAAYQAALDRSRQLVDMRPELVTQQAWTLLLEQPEFVPRASAFATDAPWFTPAVPTGTAFELSVRSLRAGCPRPPSRAQAARWAEQMPYDHWTLWANEWLAVDTSPTKSAVSKVLQPLFEYDAPAILKMIEHMRISEGERFDFATTLCGLVPGECDRLGELYLLADRPVDALRAYERWSANTRDRVEVANGVTWLVRHYDAKGDHARAEATARMAANVGSARGLETLGEWLDRAGRHDEADAVYAQISARYPGSRSSYLEGLSLMRKALRTGDAHVRARAAELLRGVFPGGPEALVLHALDATPQDGLVFETFGPRVADAGLLPQDIIVGIDQWRLRSATHYNVASRFQHNQAMTFTVWRDGRYRQVKANVPERWLGARFQDFHPRPRPTR